MNFFSSLLLFAGIAVWIGFAWRVRSHQQQRPLQKAKEAADQASLAKNRYIAAISHELRTPLNAILGYAQILANDPAIPDNRRQAINIIQKSGDHLLSLIEGTLDIARIEAGKLHLEIKPLHFPEFLQQIIGLFELQAQNKGLRFDYQPADKLPAVVRADEQRLRQILINILGNAIKFTVCGTVSFRVEYRLEMAVFEIQDTGPGILPEDRARIFEPFVRGRDVQANGSGMGLTIARMLTNLMGGEMSVISTSGEGSLFRIRLFLPETQWTGMDQDKDNDQAAAKPPPHHPRQAPAPLIAPGQAHVMALEALIDLGYVRGILNQLGDIERLDPAHAEFVRILRDLARGFQFDAMKEILRKSTDVH